MSTPNVNRAGRGYERKPGSSFRCSEKHGKLRCHRRIGHLGSCSAPQGRKVTKWAPAAQ